MTNSQQFVPIADIKDDLVFLKDGSVSLVITTTAVNFGLLFEDEQISIISSFAGLLNSLSFPIQIVIHSRRLDVSTYLKTLDRALSLQSNLALKQMTAHYRQFVESIIKEKNVLDKQFYICLNVSGLELGIIQKKSSDKTRKALTILIPRRDHLLRQISRLALKARQLTTVELIRLFYNVYNTSETAIQPATPPVVNNSLPRINKAWAIPNQRVSQPATTQPSPIQVSNPPAANISTPPVVHPLITASQAMPFVVEELGDD